MSDPVSTPVSGLSAEDREGLPIYARDVLVWNAVESIVARRLAEQREQIAAAIEAVDPVEWALLGQDSGTHAATVARAGVRR
jgi:hypothetical protein